MRVAGPFTIDSLSPHRIPLVDDDNLDPPPPEGEELPAADRTLRETGPGVRYQGPAPERDFGAMMLEQLRHAGVQQAHKAGKITFSSIDGWPGEYVCGEARFMEGESERRAAIFVGPEYGTVSRQNLVTAAREASDARFDLLIACAFAYDAHTTELDRLGAMPVLKARMNADLHMSTDLKETDKANLFTLFGEPEIELEEMDDGRCRVRVLGVDVFDPSTGEVRSDGTDGIACWFVDTAYNEESFFVRHAYFLGAKNPYDSLRTTLRAEINEEAWASLHRDVSRPFARPESGRIAVKVINNLGDEVMKALSVP